MRSLKYLNKAKLVQISTLLACCLLGPCISNTALAEPSLPKNESATERGALFKDGNFAMFIHWGAYSELAGRWKGKTYYGVGEWIMSPQMANIPVDEYKEAARQFNPQKFDAEAVAKLAKAAGMRYIIITSKHHDGFSMFASKASKFNIVDHTPFKRDPMKELAAACQKEGLGFGFYYSQFQDWTTPGGGGGPKTDASGQTVTFDQYFKEKCLPEVNQLTTEYGPITLIWFDTPGNMSREQSKQLVDLVHKNQPGAFVSSRVGNGLGDYDTLGDMELVEQNRPGLWESIDVSNDSWGYVWYDKNWKSGKDILRFTISTVARGGNFLFNVGPDGKGEVPEPNRLALESAGKRIAAYPQLVYRADASPWGHALPWGDAVVNDGKIFLAIYDMPATGKLYLPGMRNAKITGLNLLTENGNVALSHEHKNDWAAISLPLRKYDNLLTVVEMTVDDIAKIEPSLPVDPQTRTVLATDFAQTQDCKKTKGLWMEKFGEWKHALQVEELTPKASVSWEVDIAEPGYYMVRLAYKGTGRLVWNIENGEGASIQNQQNSSSVFHEFPMGWLRFEKAGKHTISVRLVEGDSKNAKLKSLILEPVEI